MDNRLTILEEIVQESSQALFQRWANALPEDQRTEEALANLSKNAVESTYFIIKMFMDKFNEAAAELKNSPDTLDETTNN